MKRTLSLLLILLMIFSLSPAAAMAGESLPQGNVTPEQVENTRITQISDLATEITRTTKSTITDTIDLTPARGRSVDLQMLNPQTQQWQTQKTFTAGPQETCEIKLIYPDNWKNTNTSTWRVVVAAGQGAKAYSSENVTIVTRNRKTLKLKAKSAAIMEMETGRFFYGKTMDAKRANASTTKIMTAVLALEKKKWNSVAKITRSAVKTPYTSLKYKLNDRVRMRHLIYAAMLPSDNGSATALAIHTAGSKKAFARMMNEKAEQIGCENTHFVNPHGLDSKSHYSTAEDLAKIGAYALKNKTLSKVIKQKNYRFTTIKKRKKYKVKSTNALLGKVKGLSGIKTGTTGKAGCCFVGSYSYHGKTYITVVLGAKKNSQRWSDTKQLISYIKKYM